MRQPNNQSSDTNSHATQTHVHSRTHTDTHTYKCQLEVYKPTTNIAHTTPLRNEANQPQVTLDRDANASNTTYRANQHFVHDNDTLRHTVTPHNTTEYIALQQFKRQLTAS